LNWKNKFNFTILKLTEGYIIVNKIKKTIYQNSLVCTLLIVHQKIRFFLYIYIQISWPKWLETFQPSLVLPRSYQFYSICSSMYFIFFVFMSCPPKLFIWFFYAYTWFFICRADTFFYDNGKPSPIFFTNSIHNTSTKSHHGCQTNFFNIDTISSRWKNFKTWYMNTLSHPCKRLF